MKPTHRTTLPFAALSGLTLALTGPSLSAADFVWDGTTNTWNSAHWDAGAGLVAGPTGASSANTATINGGQVNFAGHDTFGNDGTTASAIINLNGGTLASNGWFTTIWNLNLNGGTLLANGGANGSYPSFQLAGTVTVGGSQMSTIDKTNAANSQINIGGNGNTTLTFDVADVTDNANPDLTINATLQNSNYGAGSLTKTGVGTLTLTGGNTFSGATSVNAGTLAFAGGGTLAAGAAISVASGATLAFARHDTFGNHATAVSQTITVNGGTITNANNAFTTLGAVTLNGGTINSTGGAAASFPSFSLRGPITVGGSAASTISGSGANSQMVVGVNTAGSQTTFDVANATGDVLADLTVSVPLQNNRDGAHAEIATGIIKTGAGTMVLSGANTYTGATSVNGGKLIVGVVGVGSTASGSAVTVAAGTVTDTPVATLGGTGTIGGNVSLAVQSAATFKNGGVLAPTAAASGTQLKVTGTTTFNAGSIFEWSMSAVTPATDPGAAPNPGSYSQLAGTDAITGTDAVFKVVLGAGNAFSDAFWDTAKTWNNVFSGAGATNTLASMFSSIGGSGITYDGGTSRGNVADEGYFTVSGTNTLNWTAVPEPTSALAGLLLTAGLLRRRRSNVG